VAITLGAVSLPDDLEWLDEFAWSPVAAQVEVTAGGSLLLEESAQLAGRPITLSSQPNMGCVTRSVVDALRALADSTATPNLTLTIPGRSPITVRFRRSDGAPVEARPAYHIAQNRVASTDLHVLTLRLLQV
jgi:hypothetical protein